MQAKYLYIHLPIDRPQDELMARPWGSGAFTAVIDLATHSIFGWTLGIELFLALKVVDNGVFEFYDASGKLLGSNEDSCSGYVPNRIIPPLDGYGDVVELDINAEGVIANWYEQLDWSEIDEELGFEPLPWEQL